MRAVKGSIDDAKLGNLTGLLAKIRPAVSASGPGSSKDDAYVTKVAQANVYQAMDAIDTFKVQALDSMQTTITVLESEIDKAQQYVGRVRQSDQRSDAGNLDLGNG